MKQAIVRLLVSVLSSGLLCSFLITPDRVCALPTIDQLLPSAERLEIPVDKSQLVRVSSPATRVSVIAPEVADVQILDPTLILVSGKSVGQTSLIVWTEDGDTRTIDVVVKWNTAQIQEVIRKIMPDEAIEVLSLDEAIALRGPVSEIALAEQAMEIAQSFVPKVINLLSVPGTHQVLLQVRIGEVSRSFRTEKGINFHITDPSFVGGNLLGGLISGDMSSPNVTLSDSVNLFFSLPKDHVGVFIQSLKEKGLFQMLAEPNLIARSGETASFLVGGEFPIPVAQGGLSNAITITYKEYGVRLNFTPTVVAERTIELAIAPEVSDLDFGQGIKLGGFLIPVITTRRAQTVVKLNDGQTFAIAGLISQSKEKASRKTPPLGNVPIFGGLFRNREMRGEETELLIMVTPHLIAPLPSADGYRMPADYSDFGEGKESLREKDIAAVDGTGQSDSPNPKQEPTSHRDPLKQEIASRTAPFVQQTSMRRNLSTVPGDDENVLSDETIAVIQSR